VSLAWWRGIAPTWTGGDPAAIPTHPDLGVRYPWREVVLHARGRALERRVGQARRVLDQAAATDGADWRIALSGGKDSSALALLCQLFGHGWRAITCSDDLSMPGEDAWVDHLAAHLGIPLDRVAPAESMRALIEAGGISLTGDIHTRGSLLARRAFYGPLDTHRAKHGYNGIVWGIRGEESRGRQMGRQAHGLLYYAHGEAVWRCQPLGDWSGLDIHAFLLRHEVPLQPTYLCVDPGADPYRLRTDWFFAGGVPARLFGHYVWLRRWWPALYDWCARVDPDVAGLS
jgi:3'-phosphoadenosine 5'-phosphosulfate sulfotransferase (PAPS reductase)/FAD synthetase